MQHNSSAALALQNTNAHSSLSHFHFTRHAFLQNLMSSAHNALRSSQPSPTSHHTLPHRLTQHTPHARLAHRTCLAATRRRPVQLPGTLLRTVVRKAVTLIRAVIIIKCVIGVGKRLVPRVHEGVHLCVRVRFTVACEVWRMCVRRMQQVNICPISKKCGQKRTHTCAIFRILSVK